MKIYEIAVKKPVTTALIFIGIVVFGLFSFSKLSVDLYPDIELNMASVMTTYSGASAADIELNITKKLETSLSTVTDLKEITSVSKDNVSLITLEFEYGTNMDEGCKRHQVGAGYAEELSPDGAESPVVFKFSTEMMPILFMSARTSGSPQSLYKILEEKVANPINRIKGVAASYISGAPERRSRFLPIPERQTLTKLPTNR